jgi:hypothetical protein
VIPLSPGREGTLRPSEERRFSRMETTSSRRPVTPDTLVGSDEIEENRPVWRKA